jgi:hypothetical protein
LKRVVNIVSLVLSVALFLFAGDLAYALIGIRNSLQSARSDLERAESAFSDGDLPAARRFFEQAEESSKSAAGYAKQPALALTANFSPFEPDTRVIRTLPDAARLSAKAGLEAVKGGAALGIEDTDGIAASLYSGGQIRLDALAKARPFVERATAYLDDADLMLASAPVASVSYLQDALDEASNRIGQALTTASKGNALLTSLPSLLGEDAPRRYLLAFQALGEARATGGLIGLYGVLSADNGKLSLGHIGPITEVFPGKIDAVEAPAWFENAYGPQTALRQVQQVNVSPNFPVVSEVLLRMFEQETGKNLDGVLSMDPVALGYLLEGTGPIEVPGSPPVTADNAAESVLHDSYVRFDRARDQNEYLGQLVSGFWKAVKAGEVNGPALAQGLAKAVSTQHVKVYSSSDDDQRSLGELGADGNYEAAGENVQMVFHNNYGLNKIDYYLRRTIDTTVAIDAGGNAHVTTNATLVNTAPSGPPSLLIGKAGEAFNPGTNRMFLNFLLPEGADVQSLDVNGETSEPPVYRDDGNTVPWGILNIDAGETVETSVSYVLPGVARAGRFEMTLFPQAAAHPDEYNLIVTAPDGFALRPASGGVSPTKTFTANGTLDQPAKVELEVTDAS